EDLFKKVTDKVNVSKQDINAYYASHKSQYVQPESREVRHILVTKKALADTLWAKLKAGANFAALAKKYSKDPGSASNGGKLTISKGQTVAEFDKTAFDLKTGELSPPIHTQYGYHIIQALTARLRRDCPWDREQTERTIVPHTVEEAYEVADAAIARDDAKLADELGDLLFQVYFLALLLSEKGQLGLEEIARGVHEKL